MKQLYFGFLLLTYPAFVWATDPVRCDCVTGDKEFADLGRARQYHEILSALENAGKKDVAEIVYKLEKVVNADSTKPLQDSIFKKEILRLCIGIAGDSSRAFLRQSESLWKLLQTEKDPAKIDAYKVRLACFAIQSRKYLPLEDSSKTKDLEDQIQALEAKIEKWKMERTVGGVSLLILMVVSAWLYWLYKGKKKDWNVQMKILKGIKAENDRLIAEPIQTPEIIPNDDAEIEDEPSLASVEKTPQIELVPTPPPQPLMPLRKLYARPPSGNLLFQVSDFFEPQTTYFVIEINPHDETSGNLLLVEDNATLLQAFSMIDTLRDACELRSTGAPSSVAQLITNEPGKVMLDNDYWTITKKIVLEW